MTISDFQSEALKPDPYYNESHATFGDRLCAARDAAGLTQKLLASKLGVKTKTIQAWESDSVEPRANKLQMVSALLNVSMVWLMSGLGKGISPPQILAAHSETEILEILHELRKVRIIGEDLIKKVDLINSKISQNDLNSKD